ncbi:MAG: hypothetical protein V4615_03235 [Bacteroidota bacterium]
MNKLGTIITTTLVVFVLQSFANDCPPLSGELIIGPSEESDFSTITAAADALQCGGVEGPVTFYIENGTYSERVVITNVNGTSVFNSITFKSQSGINSDVVISYTKTDATLVLLGSSYVSFENVTLDHKNATYGNCVRIDGEADNLTFKNVVFNGVELPRTGVANATVFCTSAAVKKEIAFADCEINNGSMGIYKSGSSPTTMDTKTSITGTVFFNQIEAGITLVNEDAPIVSGNTINSVSANNGFKAIQMSNVSNRMVINKNIVNTSNSAIGLLIHDCRAQSSSPAQIMDNTFGIGGSQNAYGIRITGSSDNAVIDFNTIKLLVNEADASLQAYFINNSSGENISMANSTYYDLAKGSYVVYSNTYKSNGNKATSPLSASAAGSIVEKGVIIK